MIWGKHDRYQRIVCQVVMAASCPKTADARREQLKGAWPACIGNAPAHGVRDCGANPAPYRRGTGAKTCGGITWRPWTDLRAFARLLCDHTNTGFVRPAKGVHLAGPSLQRSPCAAFFWRSHRTDRRRTNDLPHRLSRPSSADPGRGRAAVAGQPPYSGGLQGQRAQAVSADLM